MSDATKRDDTCKPSSEPKATRSRDADARDDGKLRLLAEELSVAKEVRETGRVRVATETHEREALVDENLARERIEIEKVPVGRRIDAVPEVAARATPRSFRWSRRFCTSNDRSC